jgi:hypothetical protein
MKLEDVMSKNRRRAGQALVEMALAMTLLTFLLSAAVDLGLAYKTHQMLINASAEASSYLSQQPIIPCNGCSVSTMKASADTQARANFRQEVGAGSTGVKIARLADLNDNGVDDISEGLDLSQWIRIDPADAGQFDPSNPGSFNIKSFKASTQQNCIDRRPLYSGGQCFIVVRARIIYKPLFALAPFINGQMTISAYAIKPIVGGT